MFRKSANVLHPPLGSEDFSSKKSQFPVAATQNALVPYDFEDSESISSGSYRDSVIDMDVDSVRYLAHGEFSATITDYLPPNVLLEIFSHVDQYDLVNLSLVSSQFYALATTRLYRRITVILNPHFPVKYNDDRRRFVGENGIKFMDSALILSLGNLNRFLDSLSRNRSLMEHIKYLVFDKCHPTAACTEDEIFDLQRHIIHLFGKNSSTLNFLHITFLDFAVGAYHLIEFLGNKNVRTMLFKLFIESLSQLYTPVVPKGLTNLFLMLSEGELARTSEIDLSKPPFDVFNSLSTLTCSTNLQLGLDIVAKIKPVNKFTKLNLKGMTIFHCHRDDPMAMLPEIDSESVLGSNGPNPLFSPQYKEYVNMMPKALDFDIINSKINLTTLHLLYLKVDCVEHRNNDCNCFPRFFRDLAEFSAANNGLPNLKSFELELFPNLEWLRPHQILETILTPLGSFLRTLSSLNRLTIDFSTPGFKMFDNSMAMSSSILNKLNERLMEAFFLCFFSSDKNKTILNLKTLQLPDFLTSFIYYKPDFYGSLLHTCRCRGCGLVLKRLEEMFFPLRDDDAEDDGDRTMDLESTYYILIGFVLGKLQADREVCVPIKQRAVNFDNYPIYKGQPHTLHNQFHQSHKQCSCDVGNPDSEGAMNIDNLVTTYIVHQLRPIVKYLSFIFFKLDNLMIHGIYYKNVGDKKYEAIFDDEEYPAALYDTSVEIDTNINFGKFGNPNDL